MASFTSHPQYNANTIDYDYGIIALANPAVLGTNVSNGLRLVYQRVRFTTRSLRFHSRSGQTKGFKNRVFVASPAASPPGTSGKYEGLSVCVLLVMQVH